MDSTLLRGMGMVAIFVAVASALRLAQDAAIAWRFGTGPSVDAYYFLVTLATWPVAVALSVMSLLIPPIDARLRRTDPVATRRFRGEILGAVLALAALSLPAAWWALRGVAASRIGGLDPGTAAHAAAGVAGLVATVPLGLLSALLSAWLVAAGRHILALLEGLPALVLLMVVLLVPGPILFWGTSAGIVVQVLAMALVLHRAGQLPSPHLSHSSRHWKHFSHGVLVLAAAQVVFGIVPLIDTFFAARLGEGTVASLSYTNRLVLGLQGLAGLALQRSGLPLLSGLAQHSSEATRRAALRWAAAMAILGATGGLLVAFFADALISLIFERGSFTAADRVQCATLLRYGMLQMPVFLGSLALVTALAAISARHALAWIALIDVIVKLGASVVLVPWLGAAGLMIATALMYAAAAVAAWLALRHHLKPARV